MTEEKKTPKFSMDFVGYSSMGSIRQVEVSIALTPDYDIKGVVSSFISEDGSRVLTLIFGPSDKKLGRVGYGLKQKWKQEPKSSSSLSESRKGDKQ